jgi:hypothetical protein
MRSIGSALVASLSSLLVACSGASVSELDGGLSPDAGARDARTIVDGGAVTPDGSAADAGAEADAGVADTGSGDAGAPAEDGAALTDAAPADAAPADAAPADAEAADAGATDAAPADAGALCAIGFDDTSTATLLVSADDDRRVFVNEVLVDDLLPSRTWGTVTTVQVQVYRHPARKNVIAAQVENYFKIDGRDRGLLLDLGLTGTTAPHLLSDERWRIATTTVATFEAVAFDDSGWGTAVQEIQHPGAPWGGIFGQSEAWWIWSSDSNRPAADKPTTETMLARRTFYRTMNGAFSDTPGTCP